MKKPSLMTRAAGWRLRRRRSQPRIPHRLHELLARLSQVTRQLARLEDLDIHVMEMPVASWREGQRARLAVVADIHATPSMGDYLDEIVQQVLSLAPDAILFLGDLMNGHSEHESMPLDSIAAHLAPWKQCPLYGVLGNHDYWYGERAVRHMLQQQLGMELLEGRSARLDLGTHSVYLGGIRCLYTYQKKAGTIPIIPVEARQQHAPFILLSHTPSGAFVAPEGTLITLAGHSHGGQVCLPRGTVIKSSEPDTPRALSRGFHPREQGRRSALYTTRGVGTSVVPLRVFCQPEIFVLDLVGKDRR